MNRFRHVPSRVALLGLIAATSWGQAPQDQQNPSSTTSEWPTPNPWLAWLPDGEPADFDSWTPRIEAEARARAAARAAQLGPLPTVAESEAPGTTGANDAPVVAEWLELATIPGAPRAMAATGLLRPLPTPLPASTEPDDSITQAREITLASGSLVVVPGTIGDGLYGSGSASPSGDFDCLLLDTTPGAQLEIAVVTPEPLLGLDPMLLAWSVTGALIAINDNLPISGFLSNLDSYIQLQVPAEGELVVCAFGVSATPFPPGDEVDHLLADPFDGSSGPGAGSEGEYELWISADVPDPRDRDVWSFSLREGDVIGVAADAGARRLALRDPSGTLRARSGGADLSGIHPVASPLPGGLGGPSVAAVVDVEGDWSVEASAPSWFFAPGYQLELVAERPPLDETSAPRRQRVLLDVDGATFDRAVFGLPSAIVDLAPLADFLPAWGLAPDQLDPLIDELGEVVERVLREEIAASGGNGDARISGLAGDFDLEIFDSRSQDPFGEPDVLRVIVGGTTEELGTVTVGLAEAVDPGNFDTTGTAVVLLDFLSGPATSTTSLNQWYTNNLELWRQTIAEGVGRIAAHEAGHLLAAFHSQRDDGPTQIMDRGGRLDLVLGVGEDEVPGTTDDIEVRFGADQLEPAEGTTGLQDSLDAVSFGDPLGGQRTELAVAPLTLDFSAVVVGGSLDLEIDVSATGGLVVVVSPSLTDASTAFVLPQPGDFPAPTGTSVVFPVRFAPTAEGNHEGELHLASGGEVVVVALRGVGGLGNPELDPSALDLGDIEYGPAGLELTGELTLANAGPASLFVDAIALSGPDAELFAFEHETPIEIPAADEVVIPVRFAPGGKVGPRSARAVVLVRDPIVPRLETLLTARAHGADLLLEPASPYFFGLPRPGQTRTRSFRLRNVGDRDLELGIPVLAGPDVELFEVLSGPSPVVVAPGTRADLVVRFSPIELGNFAATLTLPTNDPDGNPLVIELRGTGAGGVAGLIPAAPVELGEVMLGDTADTSLILANVGTLTLLVSELAIEGPAAAEVTLIGTPTSFGLSPGSTIPVTFRFNPAVLGLREAALVVTSDDPSAPQRHFALFGTGIGEPGVPDPPSPLEIPTTSPLGVLVLGVLLAAAALLRLKLAKRRLRP